MLFAHFVNYDSLYSPSHNYNHSTTQHLQEIYHQKLSTFHFFCNPKATVTDYQIPFKQLLSCIIVAHGMGIYKKSELETIQKLLQDQELADILLNVGWLSFIENFEGFQEDIVEEFVTKLKNG